jgi:cytochrome c oxidase subunit IV
MSHDHHDHDSPEYLAKQSKMVWIIGGVLIFFTFITVWAAGWDLGSHARNIAFGIMIAVFKASLVALIFMHLKSERGLIYKFLAFTVVFVIGLFVLTYLGWVDPLISHVIPLN